MRIWAFDTETTRIEERQSVSTKSQHLDGSQPGGSVYVEPFTIPEFVIGSWASEEGVAAGPGPEFISNLKSVLKDPDCHIVAHNIAFDYWVVISKFPGIKESMDRAAEEGRLHDTMILDVLYRLSIGYFDKHQYKPGTGVWDKPRMLNRSLEDLASEYAGITLVKDETIRLGFGQFRGREEEISKRFLEYAKMDAFATYRVFSELVGKLQRDRRQNWLSEPIQVRASIAMAALDRRGIHIDRKLAERFLTQFEEYQVPLQTSLVSYGFGRWDKKPKSETIRTQIPLNEVPSFSPDWWCRQADGTLIKYKKYKKHATRFKTEARFALDTKAIQAELSKLGVQNPPIRDDGSLSLKYDFWSKKIHQGPLKQWLQHEKLKKIVNTYLSLYSITDVVYPRWHILGARSGRKSASGPSVQNVPKRRYGIRALFVPRPGYRFIRADYAAQEMYTLAEAMLNMSPPIKGPLYNVLTSDHDIHTHAAAIVLGVPIETVTKEERQGQKVCSFGVPGGLGPKTLADYAADTYNVQWTVSEAKKRREAFLSAFPDIREYLQRQQMTQNQALEEATGQTAGEWKEALGVQGWRIIDALIQNEDPEIQRLGLKAERMCKVVLPTGRVRAFCRFTEAANSYFQGLAADVTKEAIWRCFRTGLAVTIVVHDEIVIEVPIEADHEVYVDALERCMLEAFRDICPTVGQYAKVEVSGLLDRWGPATDPDGKIIQI